MLPHRDDLMELASARLLGEGDVSRARESETASNFYAPQHVIAARRQQLLRGLQVAVKAAIELGMETPSGMRCDESAVYELCLALESCLEHHILPPIALFSQQSGLWLVLQQMHRQVSAARNTEGTSQWEELRAVAESVALAHGLSERQIACSMPQAGPPVRSAYAARLWLCLGLTRNTLPSWVSVAAKSAAQAYGEHALLRCDEDREVLLGLLQPLGHFTFRALRPQHQLTGRSARPRPSPAARPLAHALGAPCRGRLARARAVAPAFRAGAGRAGATGAAAVAACDAAGAGGGAAADEQHQERRRGRARGRGGGGVRTARRGGGGGGRSRGGGRRARLGEVRRRRVRAARRRHS